MPHAAQRRTLLLTLMLLAGLLLGAPLAHAAGTPNISVSASSQDVLHGETVPVVVSARNPPGEPYGYNLSFRVVIPNGVTYAGGAAVAPEVIAGPGVGERTLIFSNVSDLSRNSSYDLGFRVTYDPLVYDVGDSFPIRAQAFINTDPRWVPDFDASGNPVAGPTSYTGFDGPVTGTTRIDAIEVRKDEPSPEGEILRGIHRHQTVYTVRVRNNELRPTDRIRLVDWLPAELEFLGCGGPGSDNTTRAGTGTGTFEEYLGSGRITVPDLTPDCYRPLSVETVNADPDGAGPMPSGVYTRVTWDVGLLAARASRTFRYRAAIPIRENTMTWTNGTPAITGAQAVNLDNNSGPEIRDEQDVTNYAAGTGEYNGTVTVVDEDILTRTAEDWRQRKSADTSNLQQGGLTWWTIELETSEYRSVRDATITDTLPDGLCPIGARNFTTGNEPRDAECDPVGGNLPTAPYSVDPVENADGTWTLSWDQSTFPALGRTSVSDRITLRFPSVARTHYQENLRETTPILARDTVRNEVRTDAIAIVGCVTPGSADCRTPGPQMPHDAGYGSGTRIVDASWAQQEAARPTIDKRVAASGSDCQLATYVETVPVYHPGDRVCWNLRVDFPGGVDTSPLAIADFLAAGATYEVGSDRPFGDNNVTATIDDSAAASGTVSWTVTGSYVPRGAQVFEHVISTIVEPPRAVNGEILGNLMKFSSRNTEEVSDPLRDSVDIRLETPVVDLLKGVARIDRGATQAAGPFGANVDHRIVQADDLVTYRLDVRNTGGQDAEGVVVWDVLPMEYDCALPGISAISNGGRCVDGGIGADRIEWTLPLVARGATVTVTYAARIPSDIGPSRQLNNTAGVTTFYGRTNLGGRYDYVPANNIDRSTDPARVNAPAADDPSDVYTNDATVAKTRTTSVTEAGNAAANQATIGETITYTVTTTIPAGTTLGGSARLDDVLDSTTRQPFVPGSASATLDGAALPGGFILDQSGTTPRVTFPADYAVPPNGPDRVLVLTFRTTVADVAPANTRTAGDLTNRATLTWTDADVGTRSRTSPTVTTQIVEPLLSQRKTDDRNPARVLPGDVVTYTVTTTNGAGGAARVSLAHDVVISDVVPVGLTPVGPAPGNAPLADGATVPGTGGAVWNAGPRTISRTVPTIAPGDAGASSVSYRLRVDDPAVGGAELTNVVTSRTASMRTGEAGRRTSGTGYEARAQDTIRIQGASIAKSVTPTSATIGDLVTYDVLVSIPADIALYDVTVRDVLPDAIRFAAYGATSCVSGDCAGLGAVDRYDPVANGDGTTTLAWDLGDIATPLSAPTVMRLTYTAHVRDTHANGGANVVVGETAVNTIDVASNRTNRVLTFDRTRIPTGHEEVSPPARATVTVVEPRVRIDKRVGVGGGALVDGPATAQSDDVLTYELVVRNSGNAPAHDVVVTDLPDTELTDVRPDALPAGVTETDGWTVGDPAMAWTVAGPIAAGDSVTLRYTARLVAASGLSDGQAIDNVARIPSYFGVRRSERTDPRNAAVVYRDYRDGGQDSTRVVLDFPTLSLVKTTGLGGTPDTGMARVGESYPWRVVVRNTSTTAAARDVVVTDTLPANWAYDAATAVVTPGGPAEPTVTDLPTGDRMAWTIPSLAPGATATVTYTATPAPDAQVDPGLGNEAQVNVAQVTSARDEAGNTGTRDGTYGTPRDPATATLEVPQLTIAKTPDGGSATAGTASSFTIAVRNAGAAPASNVIVADVLPRGLTYDAGTATASPATGFAEQSVDPGPGAGETSIAWSIATIASGDTVTITVPVRVAASVLDGTTLVNRSSARSDQQPTPVRDDGSLLVEAETNLSIEKDGPARYVAGRDLTWRVRVQNRGPSDAQDVVVSDPLPAGTSFVSADAPCAATGGTVRCALGTVPVGFDRTYEVTVRVAPETDVAELTNVARVETSTDETDPSDNENDHRSTPDPLADVTVAKTADPEAIARGHEATFTLTVRNVGPSVARDVVLADVLPDELPLVAVDAASCRATGQALECALGDLGVDQPVAIRVTVRGPQVGTWRNTATVTTRTPQPPGGGEPDSDDATVRVDPVADLGVVKSGPASVDAGGRIAWDLVVTNHGGDDATGVVVTDELPAGVTDVAPGAGCTLAGSTVRCAIGDLAVGASATVRIEATAPVADAASTLVNVAAVDGDQVDERPENDRDDAVTQVRPRVVPPPPAPQGHDVQVSKRVRPGSRPVLGGTFAYELVVTNNGPAAATGVTLADAVPAALRPTKAAGSGSRCAIRGQRVSCALGTLEAGARRTVLLTVRALREGTVRNVAEVSSEGVDAVPANDVDAAAVQIAVPRAALRLTKRSLSRRPVPLGATTRYRLVVRNVSRAPARDVVVCDRLPDGLALRSTGGGRLRAGELCWQVGTLAPGARRTLSFSARVLGDARGPRLVNVATATASNAASRRARAAIRLAGPGTGVLPGFGRGGGVTG